MVILTGGELQRGQNIFRFKHGIILQNFVVARACCQEFQGVLHADTQGAKCRPAAAAFEVKLCDTIPT
jgi:hypothetical protein